MALTRAEVVKIAALAKLHFSASELDAFMSQFQHILHYIEKLREVPVDNVTPTSHVSSSEDSDWNCLRADEIRPSLDIVEACKNAPDCEHGHFRVPKVI